MLFRSSRSKFQDTRVISPFSTPDHVPSSLLLRVCKRWASAGTSLLYNVVILRSNAQARALQRTLRKHSHLGNHIKMLRVEGGYGSAMRTILTCAPNIVDLFITLGMSTEDSITGLRAALPSVNPTRVTVRFPHARRQGELSINLTQVLNSCFEIWTNMVSY